MQQLGKDREGRPIHKGECVQFTQGGVTRTGVLAGVHEDVGIKLLVIIRKNLKYYIFEREIVREVAGRLTPATASWSKEFMKSIMK